MIARLSGFALAVLLTACTMERRGGQDAAGSSSASGGAAAAHPAAPVDTVPKDSLSALLTAAEFGEAGTNRVIPVPMDTAGPPELAGAAEVARNVELLGSVGPYAFVTSRLYQFGCGAHGNTAENFHVMNLATGREDTLLDSAAAAAVAQAAREKIVAAFKADTSEGARSVDHPDSARLTLLIPSWAGGRLAVAEQFTAEACYACSDGRWDDYSRSVRMPAEQLPPRLAPYATVPPEIQAAFRILTPDSGAGWSTITMPAARRDALAHLFGVTAPAGGVEYLVWRRLQGTHFETAWIRGSGAEATVVGRQPDVWIVAGGRAWTWRTREDRIKVTPCSMQRGNP